MENQRTKYRYKGKKEVYDPKSGERVLATAFESYQQDVFYKVFQNGRGRMFPKGMSGATHEVIQFLIINLRKDNLVFYDPDELFKELEVSPANAKKIKATLLAKDIMRPRRGGAYIFNPAYGCIVTGNERLAIFEEYQKLPAPATEMTAPEEIDHYEVDQRRKYNKLNPEGGE